MSLWVYFNSSCLLALLVGALAGFDDLRKRYGEVCIEATRTKLGFSYLVVRGLLPMILFLGLYYWHRIEGSAWQALALGTGWEAFFRSGFYTGAKSGKAFRGPCELLLGLQGFLLSRNDAPVAELRKQYVDKYLPGGLDCLGLCNRILLNVGAWPVVQTQKALEQKLARLKKNAATINAATIKECRHRVAYLVLDEVGRRGFQTLLSDSLSHSVQLGSPTSASSGTQKPRRE